MVRWIRHTDRVHLDHTTCYAAVQSRDNRFDGWFVGAVRTTGIYCRPSCPAVTPKPGNIEFFPTAATAQQHGYRACKRCRPDASPGSPEWNVRTDVVARAMRLIADGLVDRQGVGGLAGRLGYSERQMHRLLVAELGAGPLALARAQRAQTARVLIETTAMPITDIAFASGFSSVRQFNDTIREVYASSPSALRKVNAPSPGPGGLTLRLAYREPLNAEALFGFLGSRAVPGVETWDGRTYARALRLGHGCAVAALTPGVGAITCSLWLDDLADAQSAVQRCRRMLDLDSDPLAIDAQLEADPLLAPLVMKRPGLRSPGHPDGTELLVRAILGQQISVRGARTLAARLVAAAGEPLASPRNGITHAFASAATMSEVDPGHFAMPKARSRALVGACREIAEGRLQIDAGSDREQVRSELVALPGIGAWTADYVAMRALGDPDVFLPTDVGVRNALVALGSRGTAAAALEHSTRWRPWRSYALHHLWASL